MQTLTPFVIGVNESEINGKTFPISVLAGKDAFVEFLNFSGFKVLANFQNQGQVTIAPYSQSIWPIIANQLGTQTIVLMAKQMYMQSTYLDGDALVPYGLLMPQIIVNIYEQGETNWYAPFTYTNPVLQSVSMWAATNGTAGFTLQLLDEASNPFPMCFLTGFDLSIGASTAGGSGHMDITNLSQPFTLAATPPRYFYHAEATTSSSIIVRFPAPIPQIGASGGGPSTLPITFTATAANNASIGLVAYFLIN